MNLDSRVITVILFLTVQSVGAIWWASGLSSEVERLSGLVDKSDKFQTDIQNAVSGLDLLNFKVEELWKAIDKLEQADATLRDVDNEIMVQHESIFEWMANTGPEQTAKGNPYGG
jgi:FtsZ-binding cell division protein ZapB